MVRAQLATWPQYVRKVRGSGPLGISHTDPHLVTDDPGAHNSMLCFAYVAALASRGKERLRVLDWGSGLGHFYEVARSVLPEVSLEYTCKELPLLCEAGRQALPQVTFLESDAAALAQRYDLVLSSSSLQYAEEWRRLLTALAGAATDYLYVTSLPLVWRVPSYVAVQRPYACGYGTEYLGWVLNRQEVLEVAREAGAELVREFVIDARPEIRGAPEEPSYGGFLFRRRHPSPSSSD